VKIASFFYGPDAMGDGDILLFAAIGAMVGVDLVPALLIASCCIFVCYAYPMRVFGLSRANDPVRSTGAGEMGSRVLAMGPAIVGAGILCLLFPTHLASPLAEVMGLR
jgi:prepilin signal peptidase PulO-like enzyme (type II secretory pathway)